MAGTARHDRSGGRGAWSRTWGRYILRGLPRETWHRGRLEGRLAGCPGYPQPSCYRFPTPSGPAGRDSRCRPFGVLLRVSTNVRPCWRRSDCGSALLREPTAATRHASSAGRRRTGPKRTLFREPKPGSRPVARPRSTVDPVPATPLRGWRRAPGTSSGHRSLVGFGRDRRLFRGPTGSFRLSLRPPVSGRTWTRAAAPSGVAASARGRPLATGRRSNLDAG
jgi:hypothetical protein